MESRPPKQLSMNQAAAHWARITGTPRPHRGTLIRWSTRGVRGCRLHAEPIGGRWYTTPQAIEAFLQSLTATAPRDEIGAAPAGAARTAQVQRALDELDAKIGPKRAGRRRGGAA